MMVLFRVIGPDVERHHWFMRPLRPAGGMI